VIEGNVVATGIRLGLVVSRWNSFIVEKLEAGSLDALVRHGGKIEDATVVRVPGAFEIPLVADRFARCGKYAAVLCLGAVIRGETTHDQHINRAVSLALTESAVNSGVPVLFGLLTCETMEQAIHRSGGNVGNKGSDCAQAALEMVSLLRNLDERSDN